MASLSVEGAADTLVVVAFMEHVLGLVLRPGAVVVLDNLAPYKAARERALIDGAGCSSRRPTARTPNRSNRHGAR